MRWRQLSDIGTGKGDLRYGMAPERDGHLRALLRQSFGDQFGASQMADA